MDVTDQYMDTARRVRLNHVLLPYPKHLLQPCSRCGAHVWTDQETDLLIRNMVRCRECNLEARCEDIAYPLVGQD